MSDIKDQVAENEKIRIETLRKNLSKAVNDFCNAYTGSATTPSMHDTYVYKEVIPRLEQLNNSLWHYCNWRFSGKCGEGQE